MRPRRVDERIPGAIGHSLAAREGDAIVGRLREADVDERRTSGPFRAEFIESATNVAVGQSGDLRVEIMLVGRGREIAGQQRLARRGAAPGRAGVVGIGIVDA